jgi:hypothetical protein
MTPTLPGAPHTLEAVIARLLIGVALLIVSSPVAANATGGHAVAYEGTVLAQTSPTIEPATPSPSPTASPSPGPGDESGITTAAGIVIAGILIGGLLLMRTKLLRR